MAYPVGHHGRIRARIVESARRLFNRHGFESVSIDAIMAGAGLTRGAFYGYFESKSGLYAEVLSCFFTDPTWKNRWKGVEIDPSAPGVASQIVRAYLSRQHLGDVENSCPMVALPCDVARSDDTVKAAFETVFKAMVAMLGAEIDGPLRRREETAMAISVLCIGGMVVARSMSDDGFAARVLAASANAAIALGGWSARSTRKPRAAPAQRKLKRFRKS